jgi:glycosyltransferase involved in cell wall biosynthesis
LLLCYHFFHPDDVVSARMFTDLAVEQTRRGWQVSVLTSNRLWRDPHAQLPRFERWNDVEIHRVFRPPWDQARPFERLGNSAWMLASWLARARSLGAQRDGAQPASAQPASAQPARSFDAIVVGSDPAFSALMAPVLRRMFPRAAIVHWCFDLYPEAITAEGIGQTHVEKAARGLMRIAYGAYDALVDIGPRMRERLAEYGASGRQETLVPWALAETDRPIAVDTTARRALFPDAKLALLYSGTMGRAHEFSAFLRLARICRARTGNAISICFSVRGNRADELTREITPDDTNVSLAPFADEATLHARLAAADLHLVSLRADWAGVVVPSKFFASLAVGRPVLYAGPADSEIARWIAEHDIGFRVTDGTTDEVADRLHRLLDDGDGLARLRERALAVYRREWSKAVTNDRWDRLLRDLLQARA